MDRQRYLDTQRRLLSLARQMYELDVEPFLEAIESAEAIAPIIDPTAFRHGARNLSIIKQLAEAAVAFKRAYPAPETVIEAALNAQSYRPDDQPGESIVGRFGHEVPPPPAPLAPVDQVGDEEDAPPVERPPLDPRLTRERAGARAYPLPSDQTTAALRANRQAYKDLAKREPAP